MSKLLPCLLIAAFAVSCFGWGCTFRWAFRPKNGAWPTTVVLGLAVLVTLGGLLNLARLVSPVALAILFAIGLLAALLACLYRFKDRTALLVVFRQNKSIWIVGSAVAILVLLYTTLTQLPPSAYNLDDDFTKYFTHPVRMLQTGTIRASVFSPCGVDTLGGQAFIQGFVLAFFPIVYINAADAVFGLLLCLLLISQLSVDQPRNLIALLFGLAGVLLIDPQYVNVSALYLGSAFILGILCLSADTHELDNAGLPHAAATGILYASLSSLKTTLALFSLLHLFATTAAIALSTHSVRRSLRWAVHTTVAAVLSVAPWLIVHFPRYLAMFLSSRDPVSVPDGPTYIADLFSSARNMYGIISIRDYTFLLATVALAMLLSILAKQKEVGPKRFVPWMIVASAVSGILFYLLTVFSYTQLMVRYSTPISIAIAPATFVCALRVVTWNSRWSRIARLAIFLSYAAALALFLPSWLSRYHLSVASGNILGFPAGASPSYCKICQTLLDRRPRIELIQSLAPPGAPILAWISTPFFLNFARNPIVDFHPVTLQTYWGKLPKVSYVILQYGQMYDSLDSVSGEPIPFLRREHIRLYATTYDIFRMIDGGDILFDDGSIKLVRLRS